MGKNFFSACNHSQATQASFLTRPTAKDSMYGGAAVSSVLGGMFFKHLQERNLQRDRNIRCSSKSVGFGVSSVSWCTLFNLSEAQFPSVQFSSVAQSCPTLCDPMNRSTPGLPVHHQLLEFTQTHVLRVSDDIQPSHPLSSPSPPAPNPSQHQSLFQ